MIADFLEETGPLPFQWGDVDCACWAASLVARATGVDPAGAYRGTYSNWPGARQVWIKGGGLRKLCRDAMSFLPGDERANGVALVRVGNRDLCGVLVHGKIALKKDRGLIVTGSFDLVEGWSLWPGR